MKYNNDFRHDLKLGQLGEKGLGKIFSESTVEVKTDLKANKTGNVFVEYESRNKPSGLVTTEADWWCFIVSNTQLVLIRTDKLKEITRAHWGNRVLGGDSNTSKGVLIPVSVLSTFK